MTSSRNYVLALTVSLLAAGLAIRYRARRHEAVRDTTDLQTWENEGGNSAPPAVANPPS